MNVRGIGSQGSTGGGTESREEDQRGEHEPGAFGYGSLCPLRYIYVDRSWLECCPENSLRSPDMAMSNSGLRKEKRLCDHQDGIRPQNDQGTLTVENGSKYVTSFGENTKYQCQLSP